ncbi:MAG: hypothetical protein AB8H12_17865 [Lewinella sp.]
MLELRSDGYSKPAVAGHSRDVGPILKEYALALPTSPAPAAAPN